MIVLFLTAILGLTSNGRRLFRTDWWKATNRPSLKIKIDLAGMMQPNGLRGAQAPYKFIETLCWYLHVWNFLRTVGTSRACFLCFKRVWFHFNPTWRVWSVKISHFTHCHHADSSFLHLAFLPRFHLWILAVKFDTTVIWCPCYIFFKEVCQKALKYRFLKIRVP